MGTDALIEIGKTAGAVTVIGGALVMAWKGLRAMLRTMRKLGRLADEVLGDGDDRPGWGARLTAIEKRVGTVEDRVGTVVDEVRPNGGASMRDQIGRIERATGAGPLAGAPPASQ